MISAVNIYISCPCALDEKFFFFSWGDKYIYELMKRLLHSLKSRTQWRFELCTRFNCCVKYTWPCLLFAVSDLSSCVSLASYRLIRTIKGQTTKHYMNKIIDELNQSVFFNRFIRSENRRWLKLFYDEFPVSLENNI